MTEVHYGVVRVGQHWSIIGDNLRFGTYDTRREAREAVRRLAAHSSGLGLPVLMHEQQDDWTLPRPIQLS